MKFSTKKIFSIFKKIGSDADHDWFLVVIFSVFLSFIFVVYSIFTYISLPKEEEALINLSADRSFIDKKALSEIFDLYDQKQKKFEKVESGGINLADPSF